MEYNNGIYIKYLKEEITKSQILSYTASLGLNRLLIYLNLFPGIELLKGLPKQEQYSILKDWNKYSYWQTRIKEIKNSIDSLTKFYQSKKSFNIQTEFTRGIIFQPDNQKVNLGIYIISIILVN